jgi:hypothetical protein
MAVTLCQTSNEQLTFSACADESSRQKKKALALMSKLQRAFMIKEPWQLNNTSGTYLLTYGAELFLRSHQLCSHSRTSQHFKEPEGSSPCSQEPSTGPYPEPDRSSPHNLVRSTLILSTHLRLGLHSALIPSGFPTNILYTYITDSIIFAIF